MASIAKWNMKNKAQFEGIPALVEDAKNDPVAFGRLTTFTFSLSIAICTAAWGQRMTPKT